MSSTFVATQRNHNSRFSSAADGAVARQVRRLARQRAARLTRVEILATIVVVVALLVGILIATRPSAGPVVQERVRVEQGDSLWTLAKTHPAPGLSTAQTAEQIRRLNGLATSQVAAGQALIVPSVQGNLTVALR